MNDVRLSQKEHNLWERLLSEGAGDDAWRILVLRIIAFYRDPMEAVINDYLENPVHMRRVVRVRISSGVRQHGSCRLNRTKRDACSLTFSRHLFFPGNLNRLIGVVCHEMLHACLPYREGHGKMFRFFMERLNEKLGTDMKVHSSEDSIRQSEVLYKYKVICKNCGNTTYYLRAGRLVKYPARYFCTRCGLSRFVVERLR